MIVEDHDMSDCLAAYAYKSRLDREASLLSSRCGIRQPVGSNHHHSFLKRSKIDISQNMKFFLYALSGVHSTTALQCSSLKARRRDPYRFWNERQHDDAQHDHKHRH
jgi:hypothetical protein